MTDAELRKKNLYLTQIIQAYMKENGYEAADCVSFFFDNCLGTLYAASLELKDGVDILDLMKSEFIKNYETFVVRFREYYGSK